MRVIGEHYTASSPVTPRPTTPTIEQHQREVQAGNDVTPTPEVGGDPATCVRGPENNEKRSFFPFSFVFVKAKPTRTKN